MEGNERHCISAADGLDLFEQFCQAAGIEPGMPRLGVFLALPADTQDELWVEAATREHKAAA